MSGTGSLTYCQWIRVCHRMYNVERFVVFCVLICLCLPYSEQCSARSEEVDRKANDEVNQNPFKNYLGKRIKQRKFNSPKDIVYGFKPVNVLKTFLDKIPGNKLAKLSSSSNNQP